MNKYQIIEELAKDKVVEELVQHSAHQPMSADLYDLSQMVYLILLEYDDDKIIDLYENKQIRYFIVRIILNQFLSNNSPFHYIYRKFRQQIDETIEVMRNVDRWEMDKLSTYRILMDAKGE